jgi:heme exporter protein B
MIRQIFILFRKDLTVELRGREIAPAMLVFGLAVLVVLSFTFGGARSEFQQLAPGVLWTTFAFAGLLGLSRIFASEREQGGLEALRLLPVEPGTLFLGKWLGATLSMLVAAAALFPVFIMLLDPAPGWSFMQFLLVMVLGVSAFCAVGTLFSAVSANTRLREVFLPILLFPAAIPALIAAVECTNGILSGAGPGEGLKILVGCNVVYLVVSYLIFGAVLEE